MSGQDKQCGSDGLRPDPTLSVSRDLGKLDVLGTPSNGFGLSWTVGG